MRRRWTPRATDFRCDNAWSSMRLDRRQFVRQVLNPRRGAMRRRSLRHRRRGAIRYRHLREAMNLEQPRGAGLQWSEPGPGCRLSDAGQPGVVHDHPRKACSLRVLHANEVASFPGEQVDLEAGDNRPQGHSTRATGDDLSRETGWTCADRAAWGVLPRRLRSERSRRAGSKSLPTPEASKWPQAGSSIRHDRER